VVMIWGRGGSECLVWGSWFSLWGSSWCVRT